MFLPYATLPISKLASKCCQKWNQVCRHGFQGRENKYKRGAFALNILLHWGSRVGVLRDHFYFRGLHDKFSGFIFCLVFPRAFSIAGFLYQSHGSALARPPRAPSSESPLQPASILLKLVRALLCGRGDLVYKLLSPFPLQTKPLFLF